MGETFRMLQSINIQLPPATAYKRYQREYLHSVSYWFFMLFIIAPVLLVGITLCPLFADSQRAIR